MRSRKSLVVFKCEQCKKEFTAKHFKKQGAHVFCSLSCAATFGHRAGAITAACEYCGKQYRVHPSVNRKNKHHYCSRECRALYIQGANNPAYRSGWGRKREYAANWKRQRRAAIDRDASRCQVCQKTPKRTRYLHVHHIIPAWTFNGNWEKANELRNLISLCSTCHKKVEAGRIAVQPSLL